MEVQMNNQHNGTGRKAADETPTNEHPFATADQLKGINTRLGEIKSTFFSEDNLCGWTQHIVSIGLLDLDDAMKEEFTDEDPDAVRANAIESYTRTRELLTLVVSLHDLETIKF